MHEKILHSFSDRKRYNKSRKGEEPVSKYYYKVDGGCVLCLCCIYGCPVRAIRVEEDVSAVIDPDKCIGCGKCAANCQAEAIVRVEREKEE